MSFLSFSLEANTSWMLLASQIEALASSEGLGRRHKLGSCLMYMQKEFIDVVCMVETK